MFPVLRTDRFLLRQIIEADKQKVFEGLSDPEVIRYYGVSYRSLEETQKQMDWYNSLVTQQTGIWWGICLLHNSESLIGACGFNEWKKEHRRIELGYWLLPSYWHKGIMYECVRAIVDYAFTTMHIHRIEAIVEKENDHSSQFTQTQF
jgi:ribosomal-protein-alanine N-acetyltransferase